jgi:chromosome segregation ATPase
MDNDTYVKTYISRFETVLLDQVRKHVECDTKNVLYASAVQDFQKKLEEAERYGADMKSALDQALNGLQAVTLDKDEIKLTYEKLRADVSSLQSELHSSKVEANQHLNQIAILNNKLAELNNKLNASNANHETVKNNYSIVLKNLESCNAELETLKLTKKKKAVLKDQDWIDGN